jgi:flagellar M-ring protein FliF
VNGIVHLVAGSVEGLDTGDVVLVNQKGEALTGNNDPSIMLSSSQLEYQRHLEKDMETRISEILEPVVGAGKVKVRANAAVDFTRTEKTEELYDPDSQVVRSEQREVEQNGLSAPSGVPGVSSNLPTGKGYSGTTASSGMSRKKETINYEISKVVNHVVQPTGVLKRMTIAVIVDGTYEKATGSGEAAYKPRSADELAKYEALAKRAMGFSEARGDEVKVINMPFESIGQEELPRPKVEIVPVVVGTAKYFLPFLAVLLLFIFVVKPLLKVLSSAPAARQPQLTLSQQAIAELEKMKELSGASSKDSLIEWAKQNPKEAASLVRGWIEEA